MANDAEAPLPAPPPPLPKRKNAVLRLFDAPLFRDWLFWFVLAWAVIEFFAVLTYARPDDGPLWVNAVLGMLLFAVLFGSDNTVRGTRTTPGTSHLALALATAERPS